MAQVLEIVVIFSIVLSVAFLLLGWYGHNIILKSNPCKMTYSTRTTFPVIMESAGWKYQIRKISNPHSQKLNPQPVLFIPGHLGR